MTQKIIKILHRTVSYACFAGTAAILIMMLLTVADVSGRSFLNHPISGTVEISGYLLAIITLLSFGYAQQANTMVRVEFFTSKMPRPVQAIFSSLFTFVTLVIFLLVVWQGYLGGMNTFHNKTASDVLHIPSYPFQFLVIIGAFLLVIELLIKLITDLNSLRTGVYKEAATGKEVAGID